MRKALTVFMSILLIVCFTATISTAAKREKFGVEKRHAVVKKLKMTTSDAKYNWKMVMPWSKGLLFYDIAQYFADSVYLCSGGRLKIKCFSAGELVPAMQSFDAVSKGSADCGHDWPGYWKGKEETFNAFASVPFGLDAEGYNIWLYERGGDKMMNDLYGKWGMVAFPCGNVGQELGLSSNKRAEKMSDFKGMKIRTVGWYMDILNRLGASVVPMPGGEVYLALERGVVDAAEFSSPAINYPMGFDDICKYVLVPGIHQPSCQSALFINKKKWDELPPDLQWIVKTCARDTQLFANHWVENLNTKAIELFEKKMEFVRLDEDARNAFAKAAYEYLEEIKAKNALLKETLDSQEQFKAEFSHWREMRSGVAPWPFKEYMKGKHMQ
jgi:TRAP-type mannitol/chloroaromatic compound transport system substrate-binding protein